MKRIETKEVRERKKKRNQILIGVVMIILLVVSTAGFALLNRDVDSQNSGSEVREYNGIEFYRQQNLWVTEINGKALAFSYLPQEIEDVEISLTHTVNNLIGKPLYLVNASSAKDIIGFNLMPEFAQRINEACLSTENCNESDYPIKDCFVDNIIVYRDNEEITKVYQENNCIIIEGDKAKGTDRFLQRILGIV
jgi:hypothetical protein